MVLLPKCSYPVPNITWFFGMTCSSRIKIVFFLFVSFCIVVSLTRLQGVIFHTSFNSLSNIWSILWVPIFESLCSVAQLGIEPNLAVPMKISGKIKSKRYANSHVRQILWRRYNYSYRFSRVAIIPYLLSTFVFYYDKPHLESHLLQIPLCGFIIQCSLFLRTLIVSVLLLVVMAGVYQWAKVFHVFANDQRSVYPFYHSSSLIFLLLFWGYLKLCFT